MAPWVVELTSDGRDTDSEEAGVGQAGHGSCVEEGENCFGDGFFLW